MTDALQRTVRRCTALLLLPLCVLVVEISQLAGYGGSSALFPLLLTVLVPSALFAVSALYLAWGFLVSGAGGPDPVETE